MCYMVLLSTTSDENLSVYNTEHAGVDCIDAWEHKEMFSVGSATISVDLKSITDGEFRFFENYHFVFCAG